MQLRFHLPDHINEHPRSCFGSRLGTAPCTILHDVSLYYVVVWVMLTSFFQFPGPSRYFVDTFLVYPRRRAEEHFWIAPLVRGDVFFRRRCGHDPRRRAEESYGNAPLVHDDGTIRHSCVHVPRRCAEESIWSTFGWRRTPGKLMISVSHCCPFSCGSSCTLGSSCTWLTLHACFK